MERPKEKTNTPPLLGDSEIAQNCLISTGGFFPVQNHVQTIFLGFAPHYLEICKNMFIFLEEICIILYVH